VNKKGAVDPYEVFEAWRLHLRKSEARNEKAKQGDATRQTAAMFQITPRRVQQLMKKEDLIRDADSAAWHAAKDKADVEWEWRAPETDAEFDAEESAAMWMHKYEHERAARERAEARARALEARVKQLEAGQTRAAARALFPDYTPPPSHNEI
jgi:hypothetical protein